MKRVKQTILLQAILLLGFTNLSSQQNDWENPRVFGINKIPVRATSISYASTDQAHSIFGDQIIRCGNINPVEIQNRSRDEISQLTKSLIKKEYGRKFILSGGCEITVDTPVENLKAMRCASIID